MKEYIFSCFFFCSKPCYSRRSNPSEGVLRIPLVVISIHRVIVFFAQGDLTMTEQLEELQLAVSTDKVSTKTDAA